MMLENADSDGSMVGVLAVPSWMPPSDFLAFVAPAQEGMSHLRMIRCVSCMLKHRVYSEHMHHRDTALNRSIALIKFRKPESALEFAEAYNGKVFNYMNVGARARFELSLGSQHLTLSLARDLSCCPHIVREHRQRRFGLYGLTSPWFCASTRF